jgi:hypothetical protein
MRTAELGAYNDECYANGQPAYSPTQIVQLVTRIAAASPGASPEILGAGAGTAVGVRWPADWAARREQNEAGDRP